MPFEPWCFHDRMFTRDDAGRYIAIQRIGREDDRVIRFHKVCARHGRAAARAKGAGEAGGTFIMGKMFRAFPRHFIAQGDEEETGMATRCLAAHGAVAFDNAAHPLRVEAHCTAKAGAASHLDP